MQSFALRQILRFVLFRRCFNHYTVARRRDLDFFVGFFLLIGPKLRLFTCLDQPYPPAGLGLSFFRVILIPIFSAFNPVFLLL